MLQGLFIILLLASGYGIAYLIYGKEGMALREKQGKKIFGVALLYGVLLAFWGMSLLFWVSGMAKGDTALCIIVTFAVPILLLVIGKNARKRVKKELSEEDK